VETDASNYAIVSIVSITSNDREIRPVAFCSCSLTLPELKYDIHNKELFAIFDTFKHWCHYLEESPILIDDVTDHKKIRIFFNNKSPNLETSPIVGISFSVQYSYLFLSRKAWFKTRCFN
jgi:hypothetical protein